MQAIEPVRDYGNIQVSGNAQVQLGDKYVTNIIEGTDSERLRIMRALSYPAMNAKRAQLSILGSPNLEWIWEPADKIGFQKWLKDPNCTDLFWISGKPASGKSTFVQYLSQNDLVRTELEKHTGRPWLILCFFFDFRGGESDANNLNGLLRALLFQLVPLNTHIETFIKESPLGKVILASSDFELSGKDMLSLIIDIVRISETRICAFVDGLDEYTGRCRDLLELLQLLRDGNIRLCVASRPEPELQRALKHCPTMRMHEHNHPTIRKIVNVAIEDLPYKQDHVVEAAETVIQSADGVVLWACFAADELRDGALSMEGKQAIKDRLAKFPTTLEEVYERMLSLIPCAHEKEAAVMLWLILQDSDGSYSQLSLLRLYHGVHTLSRRGWLANTSPQNFDLIPFCIRLQALIGRLLSMYLYHRYAQLEPFDTDRLTNDPHTSGYAHNIEVRLVHKTLHTWLHNKTKWISRRLPVGLELAYPSGVWLRIYTECVINGEDDENLSMVSGMSDLLWNCKNKDLVSGTSQSISSRPLHTLVYYALAKVIEDKQAQWHNGPKTYTLEAPLSGIRRHAQQRVMSLAIDLDCALYLQDLSDKATHRSSDQAANDIAMLFLGLGLDRFNSLKRTIWKPYSAYTVANKSNLPSHLKESQLGYFTRSWGPKMLAEHIIPTWHQKSTAEHHCSENDYMVEDQDSGNESLDVAIFRPWFVQYSMFLSDSHQYWPELHHLLHCCLLLDTRFHPRGCTIWLVTDYFFLYVIICENQPLTDMKIPALVSCTGCPPSVLIDRLQRDRKRNFMDSLRCTKYTFRQPEATDDQQIMRSVLKRRFRLSDQHRLNRQVHDWRLNKHPPGTGWKLQRPRTIASVFSK